MKSRLLCMCTWSCAGRKRPDRREGGTSGFPNHHAAEGNLPGQLVRNPARLRPGDHHRPGRGGAGGGTLPRYGGRPRPPCRRQIRRGVRRHRRHGAVDEHGYSTHRLAQPPDQECRAKMHPAPAVPQGYNQYPFLRQFGEFDPDTAYASTILPPSRTRRRFCFAHGKLSIPARTSRFCPTGSSPIREK